MTDTPTSAPVAPGTPRTLAQRQEDTLAMLRTPVRDVWVATASTAPDGTPAPYLVPLSMAWIDERVVLALDATSRTGRSLLDTRTARLSLGGTRDVVMIDADLERSVRVAEAPAEIGEGYAAQADWDPRPGGEHDVYLVLRPRRVQAWREVDELAGRTLMRDGEWL
ncbi:pyridoxamine 5'-phosphate oxidase family protein [Isoptericola sp. NPDC019693]|uniref:pyridoxamine 5'-phosphate oxidase family protein n=1 Tax=Isoptericola sp. NPDC019693 TaxID=3364009 RepID=UPI00378B790D